MSQDKNETIQLVCPNCWQPVRVGAASFCPTCGTALPTAGLRSWAGADMANVISLSATTIAIGRSADNDVRLDHPAVSAQHARLEWRAAEGAWYVIDEGSARGTYINYGQVPYGPQGLVINPQVDTLWIAPYAFRLKQGEQQQAQFVPAHLRLDGVRLVRTVRHTSKRQTVSILNLEPTPLSFRPGEFIALVGGSGAGKSTLMKALLGLAPAQTGTVYVSGRPFIKDGNGQGFAAMYAIVGYVPQDDIVHRELTAREALDYVARFRLAPDLGQDERMYYIEDTLQTVDLWPHRDKLIGKLSGGQRKRVNIALELLARPRLLFLDEPTSGLDPGLDLAIMELLREWATDPDDPRTIILVTHATENITNCKYVAFMAPGGYVVYFGTPDDALRYFDVDRFAEIYRYVGQFQVPELTLQEDNGKPAPNVLELVDRFQASTDYFKYVESRRLGEVEPAALPAAPSRRRQPLDAAARQKFWQQLQILTPRYWKLLRRDRMSFFMLLLQGLLVAGLLWAVARPDTFQARGADSAETVLFIMACAAVWLGILNSTKEIVKEQEIYAREQRYGVGATSYVLSKLLVLALIGLVQLGTLLMLISYQITLPAHGVLGAWSPVWLEWLITLELTLTSGLALGLFVSANARSIDAATAGMFVLLLIQVMFAGIFFPNAAWADLISTFTFSRWGLEGMAISADLNGLLEQAVGNAYRPDAAYTFSVLNLLGRWGILAGYVLLLTAATIVVQARKG